MCERFQSRVEATPRGNNYNSSPQDDTEEMVDVTENMDSMMLNARGSKTLRKYKKGST